MPPRISSPRTPPPTKARSCCTPPGRRVIRRAPFIPIHVRQEDAGRYWLDLQEGDRLWCTAATGWAKVVWNVFLGPWSLETEMFMQEGAFDPAERLDLVGRYGITVLCQAPTEYRVLGYETALAYAKAREQFGQPIASFQLVQQKLVEMVNEISLAQLLSVHVGRMKDAGNLDTATVSMFKMNNVAKARRIAALARDVLGGNGLLLDYRVMEHMADLEGVYSYEGTNDINTLIVGQAITGHRAFAPQPPKEHEKDGGAEQAEEGK